MYSFQPLLFLLLLLPHADATGQQLMVRFFWDKTIISHATRYNLELKHKKNGRLDINDTLVLELQKVFQSHLPLPANSRQFDKETAENLVKNLMKKVVEVAGSDEVDNWLPFVPE